ncbi:MAG TPA: hypothetical protein VGQ52_00040 [Gemmatimonadaceae bacterium]|nr:hypothetical protein [Gemmatimonadaceae bacterium]
MANADAGGDWDGAVWDFSGGAPLARGASSKPKSLKFRVRGLVGRPDTVALVTMEAIVLSVGQ